MGSITPSIYGLVSTLKLQTWSDPQKLQARENIGAASTINNTFSGLVNFSGTDTPGLQLKSLTTAQITTLASASALPVGSILVDSTTDRIDARLARGTVELVDTAGGQTIGGNLAATTLMVGGASGPLFRNNAGVIEARTNNNAAQAVLSGSAIDVTTLQIAGASVGTLVNNSGFARLVAMIAARYNSSAANSIYCTDSAESTTRVAINRGDDGTILITGQGSIGWSNPSTDVRVQSVLLGFDRLDANTVEINNGTAGAFRDLSLRNLTASGTVTTSANGAASTPATYLTGTWFSGGTGTTTKPQLLIEPTGTTSTGWNTNGSAIGVNAASGFLGALIDAKINNSTLFSVSYQGVVSGSGFTCASGWVYATVGNAFYDSSGTLQRFRIGGTTYFTIATTGVDVVGNLTASGTVRLGTFTVGTLPSAAANTRALAYVTDSSVASFGAVATAGGALGVTVFSNGTNWIVSGGTTQPQKAITSGTAAPSGGVDGDIYLQYT